MKLSTASFFIIFQAASSLSKATAETNLRGVVRELEGDDGEICHPYDLDWDDLSSEQRDAAQDLSFNANKWDADKDPSEIKNDYWIDAPDGETELTTTEREAAILLGWNEGNRCLIVYRFCFD